MQRPRSAKLEAAQLLQNLRKILCRFTAVVVSSAFWKSLKNVFSEAWDPLNFDKEKDVGTSPKIGKASSISGADATPPPVALQVVATPSV